VSDVPTANAIPETPAFTKKAGVFYHHGSGFFRQVDRALRMVGGRAGLSAPGGRADVLLLLGDAGFKTRVAVSSGGGFGPMHSMFAWLADS
jgi:hypothetical protein